MSRVAVEALLEFLNGAASPSLLSPSLHVAHETISISLNWRPPSQGCIKFSCDGAFNSRSKHGAIGIVARNWRGEVVYHWLFFFWELML